MGEHSSIEESDACKRKAFEELRSKSPEELWEMMREAFEWVKLHPLKTSPPNVDT
jgi:hypothetical protein